MPHTTSEKIPTWQDSRHLPSCLGLDSAFEAPGWPFILGSQDPHIRFIAANNGWLTRSEFLTAPFMQGKSTNLKINAAIQPFENLQIQIDFSVSNQNGYQEIFRYTGDDFEGLTPSRTGSYSISFLSLKTAFEKYRSDHFSPAFAQFEKNIEVIHTRLTALNSLAEDLDVPDANYYDNLSQDVLIPAFLAAYSGQSAENYRLNPIPRIPIPNWRIDFNGLMKIPAFEKIFSSFTLSHGYRSIYSIGNFSNNLRYMTTDQLTLNNSILNYPLATQTDEFTSFLIPTYTISQVIISEQFAPLIGINLRTKNNLNTRLEFKKERNLSLNISNTQITETVSNGVTFDFGYSKVGFKIPWRFSGRVRTLPNNITFRTSFTVRDSYTIQRRINSSSEITNGTFSYQIRPMVTYRINNQLNLTMYYDRSVTTPRFLSNFPRKTTAFGFQLRFDLSSNF